MSTDLRLRRGALGPARQQREEERPQVIARAAAGLE
jgi:hypothetical protein